MDSTERLIKIQISHIHVQTPPTEEQPLAGILTYESSYSFRLPYRWHPENFILKYSSGGCKGLAPFSLFICIMQNQFKTSYLIVIPFHTNCISLFFFMQSFPFFILCFN